MPTLRWKKGLDETASGKPRDTEVDSISVPIHCKLLYITNRLKKTHKKGRNVFFNPKKVPGIGLRSDYFEKLSIASLYCDRLE